MPAPDSPLPTSSMTTRTLGSAAMLYAKVPTPRTTRALLAGWSPAVVVSEGENFARSENPETFALVNVSAADYRHRNRHGLQILSALLRRYDDLFQLWLWSCRRRVPERRARDKR